jgi:hypothetical protein
MARTFNKEVTAKAGLKGKLDVYRYIDNVREKFTLFSILFEFSRSGTASSTLNLQLTIN